MSIPTSDIIFVFLSYMYVFGVIITAIKLRKNGKISGEIARKLVHVGIGIIVIIIPFVFKTKIIPTYIGLSFIVITFFTSPTSPITKLRLSAFIDGNSFGTVYYAISLTLLLYLFIDYGWIIQAGFLPLVFGDASANIFGKRYGSHSWIYFKDKSIEGSAAAFISTTIVLVIVLQIYMILKLFDGSLLFIVGFSLFQGFIMAITELVSPRGLDNLTVPIVNTISAVLIGPIFISDLSIF